MLLTSLSTQPMALGIMPSYRAAHVPRLERRRALLPLQLVRRALLQVPRQVER